MYSTSDALPLAMSAVAACLSPVQSPKLQPGDDPRQDPKFTEGAVDTLRMQKDNELDKYQRKTAKKAKELSQQIPSHVAVK